MMVTRKIDDDVDTVHVVLVECDVCAVWYEILRPEDWHLTEDDSVCDKHQPNPMIRVTDYQPNY